MAARTMPYAASQWMTFHWRQLYQIDMTQAYDRMMYEMLADEYYNKFGRDLATDVDAQRAKPK